MNRTIETLFAPDGALELVLDREVSGFAAEVQGALLNILTPTGSDLIFPTRGTRLFRTALDGGIFNTRSAAHASNFAAADSLFFSREFTVADTNDKLREVVLVPTFFGLGNMEIEAGFVAIDYRTLSFSFPVTTR